jgi:pSer/pThr/pTyr-binding forkhead associated (FHA) protein
MQKTPKLTVLFEKFRGQIFNLEKDTITIGRRDDMDIVLKDASVSGHHADIIRTEQDGEVIYTLRDNGSTNGTRVNNQQITEHILKNSDLITFGNVEVLLDGGMEEITETADFSHLTHTIDISALEENTTAPQNLGNFNPMAAQEAKRNAAVQKNLYRTLLLIAIGMVGLAGLVFYRIFSNK